MTHKKRFREFKLMGVKCWVNLEVEAAYNACVGDEKYQGLL
jgi:hypothetical protein